MIKITYDQDGLLLIFVLVAIVSSLITYFYTKHRYWKKGITEGLDLLTEAATLINKTKYEQYELSKTDYKGNAESISKPTKPK